jgi:hypothetical protein
VYKRLQPETPKKPPNFPPEIPGKISEIPEIPEIPEISEIPEILWDPKDIHAPVNPLERYAIVCTNRICIFPYFSVTLTYKRYNVPCTFYVCVYHTFTGGEIYFFL